MHINDNCRATLAMVLCKCCGVGDRIDHSGLRCDGCFCGRCNPNNPCRCTSKTGCSGGCGFNCYDMINNILCGFDGSKHRVPQQKVCRGCGHKFDGCKTCKRCGGCLCGLKWW